MDQPKNRDVDDAVPSQHISQVRRFLKERVMQQGGFPFHGAEPERSQVLSLLRRTMELGESNSALLIGPRGCGKSALINDTLKELTGTCKSFHDSVLVHLNGYVHTDDRLALKAITSQMQLENATGDKVFGSFAENLTYLLQCLRGGDRQSSKSIIFFLDEFDLFCNHRNQTLLYNLFDVAQSAQAPICVLGITCRKDVTELLEKRVMSRFSQRQIHLYPSADETEAESIGRRIQCMEELLSLPLKDCTERSQFSSSFIQSWNEHVNKICVEPSVRDCLRSMYEATTCERTFRNFLFLVISCLCDAHPSLQAVNVVETYRRMRQNARISLIEGLSVLELCLVIAMKHQTEIYDGEPFNFEMILSRYLKFAYRTGNMLICDRQVLLKAFEHLKSLELLRPVVSSSNQLLKEFQMFHFLILPDEVKEAVRIYPGLPTEVSQWAISDYT